MKIKVIHRSTHRPINLKINSLPHIRYYTCESKRRSHNIIVRTRSKLQLRLRCAVSGAELSIFAASGSSVLSVCALRGLETIAAAIKLEQQEAMSKIDGGIPLLGSLWKKERKNEKIRFITPRYKFMRNRSSLGKHGSVSPCLFRVR